ncbi:MFS transporter [Kineococcus rhizosphaerae]|uniref:DHA1 family purine ribonucleoside efflux pump-like MFS transporter n=1 Tax=Kineococcus rhizosphaerae TaxID=559628 RepID=A0A2T0R220_9ACTN|nr:MFS transporter [Kineococcus rhizosphaerae]PRY13608.1 DHA1 family purine ribonucleoside efflux pump-like MFS transporter [Kineococcus rhizosphaerae]
MNSDTPVTTRRGAGRIPRPRSSGRTAPRSPWPAVVALGVGVFALVTAEFLPASLLPRIAADLGISEGLAGQAVTATALAGIVAAPTVGALFPRADRRRLLAALLAAAVVSNALVALSGAFWTILLARLLLGVALAGFWGLAPAVTARLAPPDKVGRAVMVSNAGMPLATVTAVPVGTFLGEAWGWRPVFWLATAITVVALVVVWFAVPRVAPAEGAAAPGLSSLVGALRSKVLVAGLVGVGFLAGGHFTAFTYVRPALQRLPEVSTGQIATVLTVLGVASVLGNLAAGPTADRRLPLALVLWPALLAVGVVGVVAGVGPFAVVVVAAALWGFAFGGIPTIVISWLARTVPDRVEQGAGLTTSMFQVAIAVAAGVGGLLVDGAGVTTAYAVGAVAAILGGTVLRASSSPRFAARPSSRSSSDS